MPKKFTGTNTKAITSREKQKHLKEEKEKEEQRLFEEEQWKENDKQSQKKMAKKELQEKRRQEAIQKKLEINAQLEEELASIKGKTVKQTSKPKRSEIRNKLELEKNKSEESPKNQMVSDLPLEENINRLIIKEEIARNIDEALSILTDQDQVDKHPEKRMKAAYKRFEERRLKELKTDTPSLKLSQLKEMVFKEWKTSPENPLLQKSNN